MFKLGLLIFILLILFTKTTNGVHLTDTNLITDPNGIVFYKDRYHIFYQSFKFLDANVKKDENMFQKLNWGHASSTNLIDWTIHDLVVENYVDPRTIFYNGKEVKNVSRIVPFSGGTIVDNLNVTGLLKKLDEPIIMIYPSLSQFIWGEIDQETGANFIFSTVTLFYSYDGLNFIRYQKPIIEKSLTIRNFRDPSVYKYNDGHFNLMMVENLKFAIHKSSDLLNWKKISEINPKGLIPNDIVELETPNLIEIQNDTFLIYSANRELNPPHFPFYCSTRYFVGQFDGYQYRIEKNQSREFDGPDLYAVSIDQNTGTMIAMINNWKYLLEIPYNGTLCYPRHLNKIVLNNNLTYLTQEFIHLDQFNDGLIELNDQIENEIIHHFDNPNRAHYLKIKLRNLKCKSDCNFEIKFEDLNNTIMIGYNSFENEFYLDRTKSIQINEFYNNVHKFKNKFKKILINNQFDIDIILDVNTIEFLTDNGLVAITALHLNDHLNNRIPRTLKISTHKKYLTDLTIKNYKVK